MIHRKQAAKDSTCIVRTALQLIATVYIYMYSSYYAAAGCCCVHVRALRGGAFTAAAVQLYSCTNLHVVPVPAVLDLDLDLVLVRQYLRVLVGYPGTAVAKLRCRVRRT